jgi:flagellar hook-associated protein 3 FlgL
MVYVSTLSVGTASRQAVMAAQSQLTTVEKELTSGTLADPGVTLGAQSGTLVSLSAQQNRLQTLTDTNALATTRLTATTSALDTLRTTAQSFLSTLTSASATGGSSSLADAAQTNLAALTSALNTSVSGQYIFGGINSGEKPMTDYVQSPPSANKQAVDTAFVASFGVSQTSTNASQISGTDLQSFLQGPFADLFGSASYGANWSSASDSPITSRISTTQSAQTSVSANEEPFRQLAQAYTTIAEFAGGNLSSDASQAAIASATTLINSALSGLTNVEAGVGITQSSISTANDSMSAQISLLSAQAGDLDGVDAYALSTKVSSLQTQIQASYELTAQLSSMSLAQYLV